VNQPGRKNELAGLLARTIESSWVDYWESSVGLATESDGFAHARRLYALAAQAQYDDPDEWADPMIDAAVLMLLTLGDGYLIAAEKWPDGVPEGALPDYAETLDALVQSGLQAWCAERSRHRTAGPWRVRLEVASAGQQVGNSESPRHLRAFRANERRQSSVIEVGNIIVATELAVWLESYPTWLEAIYSDSDEPLLKLRAERSAWVEYLAWLRDSLPKFHALGASAEVIVGLSVVTNIVRSLLLAGLAPDGDALEELFLMPLSELDQVMEAYGLHPWIQATRQLN
jgi:hypothetical protein